MPVSYTQQDGAALAARFDVAKRMTAPGTPLRRALDMIVAGHLGALICVGDVESVIAAGHDGFPLDIQFSANRLFELSKMDGAIVIDDDLTRIYRANFHLDPDASIPTAETGMRHRTAARMSEITDAVIISISERRQVVHVYIGGTPFEIRTVAENMALVNQLLVTLQSTRQALDRNLLRLTSLELDNYVTLADVAQIFSYFEVLMTAADELDDLISQLGDESRIIAMQREQLLGGMDEEYDLMIRDYARDSSEANARKVRNAFHAMDDQAFRDLALVGRMLGYENLREDSIVSPLGLRTLNRVSVVRHGLADKIVDEYGSLQELLDDIDNPARLRDTGVREPTILADSLFRMKERRG